MAAALGPGEPAARRNVLLITLDQWRAECLGCLGHPQLKTPHMDALARDGAVFTRHYTQASPCGPARASLLTGLYLHNHRSLRNGIPLDFRHATLAGEVRRLGYDPVVFGYTDTAVDPRRYAPDDPALTTYEGLLPGFSAGLLLPETLDAWRAYLAGLGHVLPEEPQDIWLPAGGGPLGKGPSFAPPVYAAEHSETAFLTDAVLRHLALQSQRQPWFVHVAYIRPHPPYIAPAPYHALYDADAMAPPVRRPDPELEGRQHPWLAEMIRRRRQGPAFLQSRPPQYSLTERDELQIRATYLGMVTQVDDQIGRLVAALRMRGDYDDTLIIITADHGDQLGDHWLYGKDGYFNATFQIPLIVRLPDAAARGVSCTAFTEAVDLMPSILEWLGAKAPPACDGYSLLPLCGGRVPANWRREVHMGYDFRDIRNPALEQALGVGPEQSGLLILQDEAGKYVHFSGLPPLFFDLQEDPNEFVNRAGDPACQARMLEYAQRLLSWRMQHEDRTLSHIHLGQGGPAFRA